MNVELINAVIKDMGEFLKGITQEAPPGAEAITAPIVEVVTNWRNGLMDAFKPPPPRHCEHCNCVLAEQFGGLEFHKGTCPNLPL